ncbi:Crp/Fnr family transcriptional regulator [Streptomyces sp. NPDC006992]|uniref:Crp/Fnr family transcriptional regulator n=1 Tax=unclassified Streptomyces TaxID=2593676 RepID=UPI0033D843DA
MTRRSPAGRAEPPGPGPNTAGRTRSDRSEPPWPRLSLMAELPGELREPLLALGREQRFPPRTTLIQQGDLTTEVHLLVDGYVRILGDTADGRTTLLALRTRGDLVGELAALDGGPRSATVTAAGAVRGVSWAGPVFLRFLRNHPQAADAVQRSVTRKLRMATRHRVDTGAAPVLARVCGVLEQLALTHGQHTGEGVVLDMPLGQGDLAALTGSSLPSVQRAIAGLRRRGVLRTGYLRLLVLDMETLRVLARGTAGGG